MKLSSFTKVKNEVQDFKNLINKITDEKRRKDFETLLQEFQNHLNLIDDNHSTEYNGYLKPNNAKENVSSMVSIRQKFYQLKKDLS